MEEIKIGSYVRVELGARSFTGIVRSVGGDGVTIWNDATGRVRIARRSRVKVLSFPSKPDPDDSRRLSDTGRGFDVDTELIQVLKEERDAFAAKLADIGEIIEDSGCDCDCACVGYLSRRFRGRPRLPDGHDDECDEECLGCRIERVLLRGQSRGEDDLLVVGAGCTLIEALRKASLDPDNWKLADEHMPLTARRVMDRDDRWCVLVDASKVSEQDLIFDPAVLGFVYLSANKGEKT